MRVFFQKHANYFIFLIVLFLLISLKIFNPPFVKSVSYLSFDLYQKVFAQKKVTLPLGLHKIIILDEADSLTEGAQQALRMIISDYEETTRFILSCNDVSFPSSPPS